MELWWGKFSFEGMPAFRDQEDGMYWVWDPESKTYTKKQKVDQPDRGHQTGGDNNLFDPVQHTEWPGVPELEGHMANVSWPPCPNCRQTAGFSNYKFMRGYLQCNNCAHLATAEKLAELYHLGPNPNPPSNWWDEGVPHGQQTLAAEFVPEGQVKCPNCQETTDMPQCPYCQKDLTPEWHKEQQKIDYLSQPQNVNSEFTSWPDREPKRNRMKTDDSFPSMISKVASEDQCPACGQVDDWLYNGKCWGCGYDPFHPESLDLPGDTAFPENWAQPKAVRDYNLEDLESEGLNEHEQAAIKRLVLEVQQGLQHEATSYWDLTPRQLAQEYRYIPFDKEAGWEDEPVDPNQEMVPVNWTPPAPARSLEEVRATMQQYGQGTRPNQTRRKIRNNTYLEDLGDGGIGLRLHNTYVLKWYPDRIILNSGGWSSQVTRNRMNEWIPGQVMTYRREVFYIPPNTDPYAGGQYVWGDKSRWVPYQDGMAVDYQGNVLDEGRGFSPHYYSFNREAGWEDEPVDLNQQMLPVNWTPPAFKSFEEIQQMMQQYGQGTRPNQTRRKVKSNTYLEQLDDGGIGLHRCGSYVAIWYPDRIVLTAERWDDSGRTWDTLNEWIPGTTTNTYQGRFYVPPNTDPYVWGQSMWEDASQWIPYKGGMTIDYQGNVLDKSRGFSPHYYSFTLVQKLASQKLSQDEWDEWFNSGQAITEVGKWLQDKKGQIFVDQGLNSTHENIAAQNGVEWKAGIGAIGSVYNDNTADIQIIFPGAAVDPTAIQAQLQSSFGPVQLREMASAQGSDQKGTTFKPEVIQGGQWVIPPGQQGNVPITGQAWVKERSNGVRFSPEMVLVTEHLMTDDFEIYAQGVKAIITATGGLTSHAAQLAQSDLIPVIVGIGAEYNKIETGNYLKIDPARQDITVLPYLTADATPLQRNQVWNDILQYQRGREEILPTFAHYDEERAWRQANDPKLDGCPECEAPMAERDSTKFCPDCGHKQPIINVQAAEQKTAFAPAALALLGRLGLGAGAAAAGEGAAAGAAGAAPGGIGALMRGAMSPRNLLQGQGIRSMMPGQQGAGQAPEPQMQQDPNAWMQGTLSGVKTSIPLQNPDEVPDEIPDDEPFYIPTPEEEEERKRKREREREREKEPQKVPASVKQAETFGEEEAGWATKNRGENTDPEHDGSGASFKEKGDSPELLKDVNDSGGTKNDDAEEAGRLQGGGDPQKALELFNNNLPLIVEFATSEDDGSTHPILMALDEMLEAAFPGYKDAVEEAVETIEEATGEDIDQDNEEGESEEHQEKVDKPEVVASVWHYGFENTMPMAQPAPTIPVPGQAGTCQLCGQSHMPGTPCPTTPGSPVVQQPGAFGEMPGQQPVNSPTVQRVVTYVEEDGPIFEDESSLNHFEQSHPEIDDNTRLVEADASHMHHQHKRKDDFGDFGDYDSEEDVDPDLGDPEHGFTFVDEDGDPLVEGQDYELLSAEYAIPDKITVEQIDGDTMIFTIHSGDVDYRDELSGDDIETFGYKFTSPESDGIDSVSDFEMEDEDPIRPGHDPIPQVDDLTEPATVVSSLEEYTGSFRGDNPNNRDWLMEGQRVDVDPALMEKLAGKDYTPREQREFIDEDGTARNLDKLDLDGTHYVLDDDLGTGDTLW